MTIAAYLRVHHNIDHLLDKVAPPEVWKEYVSDVHRLHRFQHSQVSIHKIQQRLPFAGASADLPYQNIDYFEQKVS